jgi:monofunctional biosynthetic peptidoglycan transglycosylase
MKFLRFTLLRLLLKIAAYYVMAVLALGIVYIVIPPVSTLMLADILTFNWISRDYEPLKNINKNVLYAVIRAEDGKFCAHHGVDWESLNQVIEDAIEDEGSPARGASTISMQVAKNLFLVPHRSYARKALEIPIAMYLDFIWSKRRMMEVYLSIAEWGDGIYGIEAASQHYFKKSANNLTPYEAALLAAALPNPIRRHPDHPSKGYANYAARIQAGMFASDIGCLK